MIVQAIRSAVFYALFLGQTVVFAVVLGLMAAFVRRGQRAPDLMWAMTRYWARSNMAFLRFAVGIKSELQGLENIPAGGCIIAAKHQSDWDILAILPRVAYPAFITKRQLMDIPFFGWAARGLNAISIDRKLGGQAMPQMLADAADKLSHGSQVIIFPEGTRKAPLAAPEYKYGVTRMYLALNVPVVPVAVNSGLFWGRNSLVLWPGTARARFLPPIPPGLSQDEFNTRLVETIETGSTALALDAYREGLARPIPPELRRRLEEAAQAVAE